MTPQERQLIDELFDRLAKLETAPRDAEASRTIAQAGTRAPNALYALVQTVLVQDEALKRAHQHIEMLEGGNAQGDEPKSGSFLDTMRDALLGMPARGSVPSVRPSVPSGVRSADTGHPVWNAGGTGINGAAPAYGTPPQGYATQPYPPQGGGSSFLGTAAAAAAGMIGGSLLLGSIRSMMGGSHTAFGDQASLGGSDRSPWSSGDASNSDLARDAGINDIGAHGQSSDNSRASLFDQGSLDTADHTYDADDQDDGFDGDSGDSNNA